MHEKIEVEIDDDTITIWHKYQLAVRLSIGQDGRMHVCLPGNNVEPHRTFNSGVPHRKIEVETLVKRKEQIVGLPRLVAARAEDGKVFRPEARKRVGSSGGSGNDGPLITETERDITLNAVLDSMISYPDASKEIVAGESHRIAAMLKIGVGSVAAVRANLTRGTYGDPDTLIATRTSWLRKNAPHREVQAL